MNLHIILNECKKLGNLIQKRLKIRVIELYLARWVVRIRHFLLVLVSLHNDARCCTKHQHNHMKVELLFFAGHTFLNFFLVVLLRVASNEMLL